MGFQAVFADHLHEMVSWVCIWLLPTHRLSGATVCTQASWPRFHPPRSKREPGALSEESLGPWSPWSPWSPSSVGRALEQGEPGP